MPHHMLASDNLRHLGPPGKEKTTICHIPEDDPLGFHSITVANSALPAHIAHGDKPGPCANFCEELCDLDDDPCTKVPEGTVDCELNGCPPLVSILCSTYDFNGDGVVDDKDLILLLRTINDPLGENPQATPAMDLNHDGSVNLEDTDSLLQKLALHFGEDSPPFGFASNYGEAHSFDWTSDVDQQALGQKTPFIGRNLDETCGSTEHGIYKKGDGPAPVTNWGPFNIVNPAATATWKDHYNWVQYGAKLLAAQVAGILEDATPFYQHFRDNMGTPKVFDLENGYQEDQSITSNVDAEVAYAAEAAKEMFDGTSSFTFHAMSARSSASYPVTENWQKTIGGHVLWAVGNAVYNEAECKLDLILTIKAEDYYDFNPGQVDIATGLPDNDNARFEVLGWAKGFSSSGSMSQTKSIPLDCCGLLDCDLPPPTDRYWQCTCNHCQALECNEFHCCSSSDCLPGYGCVSNTCITMGNPRFTLIWTGDDDYDLHVITPGGAHIYYWYENLYDPVTGGMLDHDDIPTEVDYWVENIVFPLDGSAPSGVYQYYVDLFNQLGETSDDWVLSVWLGDTKVDEFNGNGSSETYSFTHTTTGP